MLKVRIFSFSFLRTGIPEDSSGNGGGFVFDCRFIHNPGKHPEFMPLTGKNPEIIEFLDSNKEMQKFLVKVYDIIDEAIEKYILRNFTDLMVSFGCTGGQHRSVYSAEKLKSYLTKRYKDKIHIELKHLDIPF
ncbi:MAG: RNase adapter RapZ [Ignavibacteria bacterium]